MWSIPLGSFNTVQSRGKKGDSGDYRGIAFNASRLKGVLFLLLLEDLDV